jgi:hypothetical protein
MIPDSPRMPMSLIIEKFRTIRIAGSVGNEQLNELRVSKRAAGEIYDHQIFNVLVRFKVVVHLRKKSST